MIVTPQLLSQDQSQVFCGAWKTSGCCFASTVRDLQVRSESSSDVGDRSSDSDSESSGESSDSSGESSDSSGASVDLGFS